MSDANVKVGGKPTLGEWSVVSKAGNLLVHAPKGFIIASMPAGWDGKTSNGLHPERMANATLIAEAGNVYHETGMTPRQLADERAKALKLSGDMLHGERDAWETNIKLNAERDRLKQENAELQAKIDRIKNAEPDWWYCDIDPDESGDSAYEAMYHHRPRLEPVELHSSYIGPRKWGVMHPSTEDDGEEATTFDTREDAQKFCDEQKATIARHTGKEG